MQVFDPLHVTDLRETALDLLAKRGLELYVQHHIGDMGERGEN